ncbi:hypothetical protein ROZALSC1DRAFT_26193, partial [Rozella allomycis CSF55]
MFYVVETDTLQLLFVSVLAALFRYLSSHGITLATFQSLKTVMEIVVDGESYLCSALKMEKVFANDKKWTMLQFTVKGDIEAIVVSRKSVVIGIVCGIMGISIIFASVLSKSLNDITDDIRELSSLNFHAVLKKN